VTSEDHLSSERLPTFDRKQINQLKPGSAREDEGQAIKYNFAFCAAGYAGDK